jgi:alpha-glucosidase (family GH31 glycosyl hydrolase)
MSSLVAFTEELFRNFDFDPIQYPDAASFIQNLTDVSGIDFQVWIANRAQSGTKLFNASTKNQWLFPNNNPLGGLGPALDLSIQEAYTYFDESLKYFAAVGVKGYKIDRGEEGEMPDYVQNEQMALFLDLAYDSMVGTWGKGGFYNFARSAVDRSRAKTHIWNGDSHANFTGLAYSVASGIRSGLISFGIWGSDTGGYTREGSLTPSPEVWARWMWFSAFSPVYELMLGTNHTPWYPPYDNTSTLAIMKQTANLHADLLPYIRSYSYHTSKTGLPIIRALFLEAEEDENTWDVNDSYFFGSEFFVAPVVSAGGSRSVYFPTGPSKSYLEYFNKTQVYSAGTNITINSPLTSIPVFVKQGAIIPRGDIYQGNAKWIDGWTPELKLELYPSFDVPESKFVYFGGGSETTIVLRTNKADRSAVVDTGGLEFNGWGVKIIWYLKGAEEGKIMDMKTESVGGLLEVNNIDTLF